MAERGRNRVAVSVPKALPADEMISTALSLAALAVLFRDKVFGVL